MIAYFDTSALFKLLIDEPGTAAVRRLWTVADRRASCALVVVEARSALAAAGRAGRVTSSQAHRVRQELEYLVDQMARVRVDESLIDAASALAESEALRGYDAVHLAAALLIGTTVLVTADGDLARAAERRGLHVADPLSSA